MLTSHICLVDETTSCLGIWKLGHVWKRETKFKVHIKMVEKWKQQKLNTENGWNIKTTIIRTEKSSWKIETNCAHGAHPVFGVVSFRTFEPFCSARNQWNMFNIAQPKRKESNDPVKYVGLYNYTPTKTTPYQLLQDVQNEHWNHHTLDIFLRVIYFNYTQAIYSTI